jgi:hypothetical protein
MKTLKTWTLGILAGGLALCTTPGWGASVGTSGGQILNTAETARYMALGNAGGCLDGDAGVVFFNPAGLYTLKRMQSLLTHESGLAQDYTENLVFAMPLENTGVMGATVLYHGMPSLNDAGEGVDSVDASDKLGMLSWAGSASPLLYGLAYGVNIKFLNSVLGPYSANALAADLGLAWKFSADAEVGLAFLNLGTSMKFDQEADPLPSRASLSGKYYLMNGSIDTLFVTGELDQTLEGSTAFRLGAEFSYADVFFGRVGYAAVPNSMEGISFGVGIQTNIAAYTIRIDYAYRIMTWSEDAFEGLQLVSLGLMY